MSKAQSQNQISGILVIGDVMLDKYWHSSSKTLSEEAPVASVVVDKTDYRAGGAANVVLNIKMLAKKGTKVGILAPLGQDNDGNILNEIISQADIFSYWQYSHLAATITKHRILTNSQQVVRVDFETNYPPIVLNNALKEIIADYKVIVLSDYNKGTLNAVSEIISYARSLNKIILVDPKGQDFNKYKGATLLTPNYKEYTDVVGQDHLDDKAYKLIKKLELDNLLVTLGAAGMTLYNKNLNYYHACSYAEQVYDVTGAGDTVIASLAVSLEQDTPRTKAIEYASYAAALVVSQIGTCYATRLAVKQLMTERELNKTRLSIQDSKIVSITHPTEVRELFNNNQFINNIKIIYWNYVKDNVLNANNLKNLIHGQQQSWVIIDNYDHAQIVDCAHNLEELAYCLSQVAAVNKVIYSKKIDLKLLIEQEQHVVQLEQECL